jgi:hypothetical protein
MDGVMIDLVKKQGRCLCGKVCVTANAVKLEVHACHCSMCQLWNGGPTLSVHCGKNVSFSNEENIAIYKSCSWPELGFCKVCGSHLFYRSIDSGEYIIQTGNFDSDNGFKLNQQIFIDEKPDFYSFSNETTDLTGPEVLEQFEANES